MGDRARLAQPDLPHRSILIAAVGQYTASKKKGDGKIGLETVDVYLYDSGELASDGRGQIHAGNVGHNMGGSSARET